MKLIFEPKTAERLHKVSHQIIERAFLMGGYKALYFESVRCNYVFTNGKPCFNPDSFSPSVDCPQCNGVGVIYKDPIETLVLAIDQPNNPQRQPEGVFFKDTIRMIVKAEIPVKILKHDSGTGRSFFMRDKFSIYTSAKNIWHSLYVDSEPKDIWLAGVLYKSFTAATHVISEREAQGDLNLELNNMENIMTNTPAENINNHSSFTEDNVEEIVKKIISGL